MSALATAPAAPGAAPVRTTRRPGLVRLTGVELRKMTDTRAGLWLLLGTAALTLAFVAFVCVAGDPPDHTFSRMLEAAMAPSNVLLPIVGILLVSSEWSQRTSLITFALVPQRGRVLLAKLLAGTLLAVAAFVLCIAVAAVATAIMAPAVAGTWSLSGGLMFQNLFVLTTSMATGIGFGAMLLASAPAIVLYFVLPLTWSVLGTLSALAGVAEWLDGSLSLDPLTSELLSGTQWARVGTTLALWMVLPLVIGWWRFRREEVG